MVPEFQAYVGPRFFEQKDKSIFFGRDFEAQDLLSMVIAHNLVLVYAQSGAGKTSLINAGLIPLLKENQFEVLPVARVKGTLLENTKTDNISNMYVFNALTSWAEGDSNVESLAKMKLVDFLNGQEHMQDEDGMPLPRAVIFDQFEEIFSLYQDRWKDRKGFFEQVNTALEADPFLRVVFVMREDFIAQLDPYADLLPEGLRTRFHMERLRREAALQAIKEPLRDTGRSFAEGVAEKLVDDLLTVRVETIPGKTAEVKGEFIEAVQLQIVCQNLWNKLPLDERQITFQHLKTYGNVEEVLSKFYGEAIRAAAEKAGTDEGDLRRLCGEVLITEMGTRGIVCRGPESTGGVSNVAIDALESMRLIRKDQRAGANWYELTHDTFIKPILSSNKDFKKESSIMRWYGICTVDRALSRTRKALFKPFDFRKWAKIAIIAFSITFFLLSNTLMQLFVLIKVLSDTYHWSAVLIFIFLFSYVYSVMEFVFVESLVRNKVKFGAYSRRFMGKGFYLLLVSLVLMLVFFTLLYLTLSNPELHSAWSILENSSDSPRSDLNERASYAFIFFFGVSIVLLLLYDAINSLLSLAIPLSIYQNKGILSAFGLVFANFRKSWHEFVVYWVIRPMFFIGVSILFVIFVFFLWFIFFVILVSLSFLLPSLQQSPWSLILDIPLILISLASLFSFPIFFFAFKVFLEYHLLSFLESWFADADIPFFDAPVLEPEKGLSETEVIS